MGTAGVRDAERRGERLDLLQNDPLGFQQATTKLARQLGVRCVKTDLKAVKNKVLVVSCPEQLRLEVVEEIVEREGRLPSAGVDAEFFAHAYVESALERRHISAESGEQLTGAQVIRWEAIFERVSSVTRIVWPEDPVFSKPRSSSRSLAISKSRVRNVA